MAGTAPKNAGKIAADHNRVLNAAYTRINSGLEKRLADVIQPILERAGQRAAAAFARTATHHLTAAALREADREALGRIEPSSRPGGFGYRLRPFTLMASAPSPDSTMICLKPRPDEAAALSIPGGEPAETLHVTLVFLGGTVGPLTEIRDALAAVAATHGPLSGVVGGVGRFQPPGVAILLPDVPGLVELRVAVTEALTDAQVDYGRDHGFEAHISVDAAPDPDTLEEALARTAQRPLHFDAILVVRGDEIVQELPLVGVLPITAAGGPGWTAPAGDEILDVDALTKEIRRKTDPVRNALVRASMTPTLGDVGVKFDVTNPLVAKVLAQTGSQIRGIAETTQLNVMRIINSAINNGLSIPETASLIRAGMTSASESRATTIARTELAGAANGGSLAAAQLVSGGTDGPPLYKQWLTAEGAVHPRHEDYDGLDGQTVALDAFFDVGGESLQFPGDPDGSPEETINCRCALAYTEEPPQDITGGSPGAGLSDAGVSTEGEVALDDAMPLTPPPGDDVSVMSAPFVPPREVDRIKEFGLDLPLRELKPTSAEGREVFAKAPTTEGLYKPGGHYNPDGTYTGGVWTAERATKHTDIIEAHFAGKTPPTLAEGEKPTAIFTAGGSASGKGGTELEIGDRSFKLSDLEKDSARVSSGPEHDKLVAEGDEWAIRGEAKYPDVILMNPDIIKELLPEYESLKNARDLYAASGVHEESSAIGKDVARLAEDRGYHVVFDTTGASNSFLDKLETAVHDGYDVKVRMVSIPTNEAIVRSMTRGDRTGRYVSIQALKQAHRGASAQLSIWKDSPIVADWKLEDNTEGRHLIAEGGNGRVVIHDQAKWDEILGKANETSAVPGSTFGREAATVTAPTAEVPALAVADAAKQVSALTDALREIRRAKLSFEAQEPEDVATLSRAAQDQLAQLQEDLSAWDLATFQERQAAAAAGTPWYSRLAATVDTQPVSTLPVYRGITDQIDVQVGDVINLPLSDFTREEQTATEYGNHVLVVRPNRTLDLHLIDADPAPLDRRLTGGNFRIEKIEQRDGKTYYELRQVDPPGRATLDPAPATKIVPA